MLGICLRGSHGYGLGSSERGSILSASDSTQATLKGLFTYLFIHLFIFFFSEVFVVSYFVVSGHRLWFHQEFHAIFKEQVCCYISK